MDSLQTKKKNSISDFLPLIVIFAVIVLFTLYMWLRNPDTGLMFVMQNFMGAFFVIFGGFKMLNWKGFAHAYAKYDIIAKRSMIYSYTYPLIELSLGLSFLVAYELLYTNIVTLIVMSVSAVGVANELRKKNPIQCACLGVIFKIPMTKVTLFEDLLMALMSTVMIINLS